MDLVLRHLIENSSKPKPTVARSHAFSRASRQLHVFTSSFDWFFSNSLIIHQVKTKKITRVKEVWIPGLK